MRPRRTARRSGRCCRRHRLGAGLTQEALAAQAGLGVRTLQAVEGGGRRPQRATAARLAVALGLAGDARASFLAGAQPLPRAAGPGRRAGGPRLVPAAPPAVAEPPGALPRPLTSFVGRAREVGILRVWLRREGVRLVTLTGPGGVGKTRLALAAAAAVAGGFAHGARFVALAPLAEPERVAAAVALAVGVRERGREPLVETLKDALRAKAVLLVLDNCEHLLAAAPLVADLLAACPRAKVLATSRAPLRLSGEREFPVAPLAVAPAPDGAGRGREG